ncbi:MAG: YggS family pyridoxal phosphate-dependent enzyme [Clostridia bacterium]|nr:YggS family pyridoxal phosphate-dependent enzyme [Clostridia bacterium]
MSILDNVKRVRERIENACARVGRNPDEITLIGVTKTHGADIINEGISAGITDIGENRVQEITAKYDDIDKAAKIHLIGHLQTNKVKYIADKVAMIHSVDSFKLAKEISRKALGCGRVMDILIQLNISGEESKSGISPECLDGLLEEISGLKGVFVRGLMTIPPIESGDMAVSRDIFRKCNKIYVDKRAKIYDNIKIDILSMGMSNDFEIAIEEGSTMVRVGRAIFGER